MGSRICMLMHDDGITVIHVQSLVVVVMMAIALGMKRLVFKFGGPGGSSRGRKQCRSLPDKGQHQHECKNRARHGQGLTALKLVDIRKHGWRKATVRFRRVAMAASCTQSKKAQAATSAHAHPCASPCASCTEPVRQSVRVTLSSDGCASGLMPWRSASSAHVSWAM